MAHRPCCGPATARIQADWHQSMAHFLLQAVFPVFLRVQRITNGRASLDSNKSQAATKFLEHCSTIAFRRSGL